MWLTHLTTFFLLLNVALGNQFYGDCSDLNGRQLLWQYEVRRTPNNQMPSQTVEAEYGPTTATISCIEVTAIGPDNGVATITSGGVGTNQVKFNFTTYRGSRIRFKVLVYGN